MKNFLMVSLIILLLSCASRKSPNLETTVGDECLPQSQEKEQGPHGEILSVEMKGHEYIVVILNSGGVAICHSASCENPVHRIPLLYLPNLDELESKASFERP